MRVLLASMIAAVIGLSPTVGLPTARFVEIYISPRTNVVSYYTNDQMPISTNDMARIFKRAAELDKALHIMVFVDDQVAVKYLVEVVNMINKYELSDYAIVAYSHGSGQTATSCTVLRGTAEDEQLLQAHPKPKGE